MVIEDVDVVIIGAGASGIAAIKQLTSTTDLGVMCVEARCGFGGVWTRDEPEPSKCTVRFDGLGRPSVEPLPIDSTPMYPGLRTNVPKELMAYRNAPFPASAEVFPPGRAVSEYLSCASAGLERYVRFGCLVKRVRYPAASQERSAQERSRRWIVELEDSSCAKGTQKGLTKPHKIACDFVLAANGHYSVPYIPYIPSLWTWPGEIMHSCVYRTPTDPIFRDKTVAVIGIGPSGYDIVRELAMVRESASSGLKTKKLYSVASHPAKLGWDFRDPAAPSWTRLITPVPRFARVDGSLIYLSDGSVLEDVEVLCFATGYLYAFPFCRPSDAPWSSHPLTRPPPAPAAAAAAPVPDACSDDDAKIGGGLRVHNVDEDHIFYFPDPSFAFLVLNSQVIPFPLAEYQARAIAARWSGRRKFPINRIDNETNESRSIHALPPPLEFEVENKLLAKIGEGGKEDEEGDEERWGDVPGWKYNCRASLPERRRQTLGY